MREDEAKKHLPRVLLDLYARARSIGETDGRAIFETTDGVHRFIIPAGGPVTYITGRDGVMRAFTFRGRRAIAGAKRWEEAK